MQAEETAKCLQKHLFLCTNTLKQQKAAAVSVTAAAQDGDVASFGRTKSSLLDSLEVGKTVELNKADELLVKKTFTDKKTEVTRSYFNCFAAIDGKTVEFAASRLNDAFSTPQGVMYRVANFASTAIACETLAGKVLKVCRKIVTPKVTFSDGVPEESKTETRVVSLFEVVE